MSVADIKALLDEWYHKTNQSVFISSDPICIPHRFSKQQDIEIAGFFAAIMAWGNRTTIINKCNALLKLMDDSPYDFVKNATDVDMKPFVGFAHRTLNDTDVLYLLAFLRQWYERNPSLETAFTSGLVQGDENVGSGLVGFYNNVFSVQPISQRTQKHIATPVKGSACKRLNMYLRWMVRQDSSGVDFGLWQGIMPSQLICPLDVHVHRVALELGLVTRRQANWATAVELTESLKQFDKDDPVKYDYALFGLGISGYAK
ncbi:MAG: hypothetical protein ACI8SE_002158 [Bacteroidia bacterium]